MKKSYVVLVIYEMLQEGKPFTTKYLENALGCTRRTCVRYIKEIKEYLKKRKPDMEVVYKAKEKSFVLQNKEVKDNN